MSTSSSGDVQHYTHSGASCKIYYIILYEHPENLTKLCEDRDGLERVNEDDRSRMRPSKSESLLAAIQRNIDYREGLLREINRKILIYKNQEEEIDRQLNPEIYKKRDIADRLRAEEARKKRYEDLVRKMNGNSSEREYLDISQGFCAMNGYADSSALAEECGKRHEDMKTLREKRERQKDRRERARKSFIVFMKVCLLILAVVVSAKVLAVNGPGAHRLDSGAIGAAFMISLIGMGLPLILLNFSSRGRGWGCGCVSAFIIVVLPSIFGSFARGINPVEAIIVLSAISVAFKAPIKER